MSYWLNSFFGIGLLLVAGSVALRTITSEIIYEIILIIFVGLLSIQVLIRPFINRHNYINTFIDEIRQILPKEDGSFE